MIRHAFRSLLRTPGLTLASVVTLAIGVGPTTAIFSLVYGVLLRPLPYPDAARLVEVSYVRSPSGQLNGFSIPEVTDWTTRPLTGSSPPRALDQLSMYGVAPFNLSNAGHVDVIRGAMVSDQFFPLLLPRLVLGRAIGADDATAPDVVISHRLWQRTFNADPLVIGRAISLNGTSYAIVGVASASFGFPTDTTDVWVPLGFAKTSLTPEWRMRGFRALSMIGRLTRGSTLAAANADAAATAGALSGAYPRFNADLSASVVPLAERLTSRVRPALMMLFGAVACVWLIACANFANLTLARSAPRAREVAIRTALGAGRRQLTTPFVAESLVLAGLGAAVGVGVAELCLHALITLPFLNLPRAGDIRPDAPVILFALGLTVLATVGFGALPAMHGSRARSGDALRDARCVTSTLASRMHPVLIVVEVAIAVTLLIGASLFVRSLGALLDAGTGARTAGVLTLRMSIASPSMDEAGQVSLIDRVLAAVDQVPGVVAAGVTSNLPPNLSQMRMSYTTQTSSTAVTDFNVEVVAATKDVFRTLGIPLIAGRSFTAADTSGSRRVLILSKRAAQTLFPDRDPIGQTLAFGRPDAAQLPPLVVGVVGDVKYGGLDTRPDGAFYRPYSQQPFRSAYLVIQTKGEDALTVAPTVRTAVQSQDAALAVTDIKTLNDVITASADEPKLRTTLLVAMAGVALALAAVGLCGVMAYSVTARTAEIALRMALGAQPGHVLAMVMRQGMGLTCAGLVLGIAGARVFAAMAGRFLYGVAPADPWSIGFAVAFALAIGGVATLIPARRATRVDPMVAWRA